MKKIKVLIFVSAMMFFAAACTGSADKSVNKSGSESSDQTKLAEAKYTCSMHPEVLSDQPGNCPKCGMELVEVDSVSVPPVDSL